MNGEFSDLPQLKRGIIPPFFLEMHRFFEQQMEQMFHDFGGVRGRFDSQRRSLEDHRDGWEIVGPQGGVFHDGESSKSDRDMMLKNDGNNN